MDTQSCPLCAQSHASHYHHDRTRDYYQCNQCFLVFVPAHQHLTPSEQKREYDLHQNQDDAGYRTFLSRLFKPMCARVTAHAEGLDFGSGPGPVLSRMFMEAGYRMTIYDKFYAANPEALQRQYDFISATELIEHVEQPSAILKKLLQCLRPKGWLGMMTKLVENQEKFKQWHYKNDPTHIAFYSQATFRWIAGAYHLDLEFIGKDVIILRKK